MAEATKRYAVVTGANKGIGFAICKQLASNGITVVLTARDEKRGLEAVEKLKGLGHVIFHQLDVTDPASIGSFANFIQTHFGKLDILVNNAGAPGAHIDGEALAAANIVENRDRIDWSKIVTENYELTEACLKTNYYGVKELTKALIPLLQFSGSPNIVNVSSSSGRLEYMPDGRPKEVISDVENLTEEKIDEILNEFLKDFKEGSLETKEWPHSMSAYTISKAALNAYTRIQAKKYPSFCINAVCPGYVKTDINQNTGFLTPDEGAEAVVRLALLSNEIERMVSRFYWGGDVDKRGLQWASSQKLTRSKFDGGLGFRDFKSFNIALVAKNWWKIYTQPETLLAQVFKGVYFAQGDLLGAKRGYRPSYAWSSILRSSWIFHEGGRWKIGDDSQVDILHDQWLPQGYLL